MKKMIAIILVVLATAILWSGCAKQEPQTVAIGNPWSDHASLEEAEAAVGFSFGLPEVVADAYTAAAYRTMNGELLEVIYRNEDLEVRVRKQAGEGQDISGDYNQYDICTETSRDGGTILTYTASNQDGVKQVIRYKGYSWSLTASNGYWGDSNTDFLDLIFEK